MNSFLIGVMITIAGMGFVQVNVYMILLQIKYWKRK